MIFLALISLFLMPVFSALPFLPSAGRKKVITRPSYVPLLSGDAGSPQDKAKRSPVTSPTSNRHVFLFYIPYRLLEDFFIQLVFDNSFDDRSFFLMFRFY